MKSEKDLLGTLVHYSRIFRATFLLVLGMGAFAGRADVVQVMPKLPPDPNYVFEVQAVVAMQASWAKFIELVSMGTSPDHIASAARFVLPSEREHFAVRSALLTAEYHKLFQLAHASGRKAVCSIDEGALKAGFYYGSCLVTLPNEIGGLEDVYVPFVYQEKTWFISFKMS